MTYQEFKDKYKVCALIHFSGALLLFSFWAPLTLCVAGLIVAHEQNDDELNRESQSLLNVLLWWIILTVPLLPLSLSQVPLIGGDRALSFAATFSILITSVAVLFSLWQGVRLLKGKPSLDAPQKLSLIALSQSLFTRKPAPTAPSEQKAVDLETHLQDTKNPGGITYVRN